MLSPNLARVDHVGQDPGHAGEERPRYARLGSWVELTEFMGIAIKDSPEYRAGLRQGDTEVESLGNIESETKRAASFLRRWYAYTKRSANKGSVKSPHKNIGSANRI